MSQSVSLFGVRHHGPGCARSLLAALHARQPDCVLIEGPAGTEALLTHVSDPAMVPPVALLSYSVDDPQLAVFHPYALFSPEWQALQWARDAGVPVQFIDVPPSLSLEWQQQAKAGQVPSMAEGEAEGDLDAATAEDTTAVTGPDDLPAVSADAPLEEAPATDADPPLPSDPLDWLARAAGYGDGEAWWNHMVEERGDGQDLFAAIAEAMHEVRAHAPPRPSARAAQDAIREAHMRAGLRAACKQYQRIAVVCGAWHVPALDAAALAAHSVAADNRLLKGMPKRKTQSTWVPWTYRHLSAGSGYGAGVDAPGWYDHLWRNAGARHQRAIGWYARVAGLLRESGLDCSSAHLIEAARLADTLAAMRERPAPGLEEINDATRSVICNGDDTPMQLIRNRLLLGDALGSVPTAVPVVPLQRDLEALQKRLRLKPEALARTLDLDLRGDTDLQRSHLLHRLALLDIPWGQLTHAGNSARGTFHEYWQLAWQPHFQVDLIDASRLGQTLAAAASQRALEEARHATQLSVLSALVDRVLLANLPEAVSAIASELEARAATDADPLTLLDALPSLANVYRYGNVRRTEGEQVAHLFDGMLQRACIGLKIALCDLDDGRAEQARETLLAADRAIALRGDEAGQQAWRRSLANVALSTTTSALVAGAGTRLLLDAGHLDGTQVNLQLQRALSAGAEPLPAAHWLDGFLNRNATVLLHDDAVWHLIDAWVCGLTDEHLVQVLPLVRRTFAEFEAAERRDLGERVKRGVGAAPAAVVASTWNITRAERALPMLRELFGVDA